MDLAALVQYQKTKTKESCGGVATFVWLIFGLYIFFTTSHRAGLIGFAIFLVGGMFVAALIVGLLTYGLHVMVLRLSMLFKIDNATVLTLIGWLLLAFNIAATSSAEKWVFAWLFGAPALAAEGTTSEFRDNEYNYTFRFPSDWKMRPPPSKEEGALGEVRAFVQGPRAMLTAIVGRHGKTVTESQFRSNPRREDAVKGMIDLSVEQYKKISKTLNANRMTVLESKELQSNAGIRFFISTVHFIDGKPPIMIVGAHLQPFEKPYMIIFQMNVVADKRAKEDQKIYDSIFNSFHLFGELPVAAGRTP